MYATTLHLDSEARLRSILSAVYTARGPALRRRASLEAPNGAHAWDVVQDAFVLVLEHPPADLSERAVSAALERAVRVVCNRDAKRAREEEVMRIQLRKQSV